MRMLIGAASVRIRRFGTWSHVASKIRAQSLNDWPKSRSTTLTLPARNVPATASSGANVCWRSTARARFAQRKIIITQRFGTQFIRENGRWSLGKIDPRVTDAQRALYGVPPLWVQQQNVDQLQQRDEDR